MKFGEFLPLKSSSPFHEVHLIPMSSSICVGSLRSYRPWIGATLMRFTVSKQKCNFPKLAAHPTNPGRPEAAKVTSPRFARNNSLKKKTVANKLNVNSNFVSCYQKCAQEIQIRQWSQSLPAAAHICVSKLINHHLWKCFILVGKPVNFSEPVILIEKNPLCIRSFHKQKKSPKIKASKIGPLKHTIMGI